MPVPYLAKVLHRVSVIDVIVIRQAEVKAEIKSHSVHDTKQFKTGIRSSLPGVLVRYDGLHGVKLVYVHKYFRLGDREDQLAQDIICSNDGIPPRRRAHLAV